MVAEMTIDEFARETNTSARNVRAYVERGLLPSPRLVGRTGYYGSVHVERMTVIQRLQREGFSLASVRALLDARERGSGLDELMGAGGDRDARDPAVIGSVDVSSLYPATKFRRPLMHADHIRRRAPLQRLLGGTRQHILIAAPGGSGKSTLAAQLLDSRAEPAGWVSLEAADNEPSRFWTTVLIGIRTAVGNFGDGLLATLVGGGDVHRVVADLAEQIAHTEPFTIVLDDLHEIADTDIVAQLRWFLDHADPARCRLVICTRTSPPLDVSRLVLGGRLSRLDTAALSFDPTEARELLDRMGVGLDTAVVGDITVRTDGWAAGLYLAATALRNRTPVATVLASLSSPNRQIQDYFADEVLAQLTPDQVGFLEQIAILDRFNAQLCDEVSGRDDSQTLLDQLATNMFVLALDDVGYWRRLHQVFAAVLRSRSVDAAGPSQCHRRAAGWYERHHHVADAIGHFLLGGGYQDAGRLIADHYPHFINVSHHGAAVGRWLAALPDELIAGSTDLSLAAACVAGLNGERLTMEHWLNTADVLIGADVDTDRSPLNLARGCFHFGEVGRALPWARAGVAACSPADPWFPMHVASLALLCLRVDGPTAEVLGLADQVLASTHRDQQPIAVAGAWALRSVVLASNGDMPGAAHAVRQADQIRAASRIDRVPQAANTWSSTAHARRLAGELDAGLHDAECGYAIVADLEPHRDATGAVVPLLIELVFANRLLGRADEAEHYAEQARSRLSALRSPGLLPAMLAEAIGPL